MQDKKYILRTPLDPFEIVPYKELYDHIGNNVGNLVYIAGVVRALMVSDGTVFEKTKHKFAYTEAEIEEINQTCDGFIISLADAIRPNYIGRLKTMADLIRKLKIPCVVIGCGLRAKYEPGSDLTFPFDDDVKDFFSAVLEHSAVIGLRGQITADYLKHLGFREETDYTVIGCPSMYMFGDKIHVKDSIEKVLTDENSPLSFNISPSVTPDTYRLISGMASNYKNSVYLPQNSRDEIMMYYGVPYEQDTTRRPYWPTSPEHPFYSEHEALFFNNALSWIDFQKSRDLSFGTRLHGNITAVLAGTPALFMPQVARTRELCEYHGFANIPRDSMEDIGSLIDVIPKLDFQGPVRRHERNFNHYLDFLKRNGIESIYDWGIPDEAPYDRRVSGFADIPPLHSVSSESPDLLRRRMKEWVKYNNPDKPVTMKGLRKKLSSILGK